MNLNFDDTTAGCEDKNGAQERPLALADKCFIGTVLSFFALMSGYEVFKLTDYHAEQIKQCLTDVLSSSGKNGYNFFVDPRSSEILSECGFWDMSLSKRAQTFFEFGVDGFLDCADKEIDVAAQKGYIRGVDDYRRFIYRCYPRYRGFTNPPTESAMRYHYNTQIKQMLAAKRSSKGKEGK